MASLISVEERLFERMYVKYVRTPEEEFRNVPPGELPGPTEEVLAVEGEPAFRVSLNQPLQCDDDVPDEVGYALRRAAHRFCQLGGDGTVRTDAMTPVEWIIGPALQDGALVMYLDTDGSMAGRALVRSMTSILVEELEGAGVPATVSVPSPATESLKDWASTEERAAEN